MNVTLTAETGRATGTAVSRRLRDGGSIPGVVYGLGREPRPVTVAWTELRQVLTTEAGLNALIDLTVDGEKGLSIITELQRHPVRRSVTHVDFLLIDPNRPLSVEVPIVLHGRSDKVEQEKGMIEQLMHVLPIQARPGSIPNQIDGDISHLEIGTQLRVGELDLPDGVTAEADADEPVAQGSPTRSTIIMQQEEARAARIAAGEEIEGDLEGADAPAPEDI